MIMQSADALPRLYEADETAWLETMVQLIGDGRLSELDYPHLREYLEDMARRDRREVLSRLSLLLAHRLKWDHQSKRRSRSWRTTIEVQRQELAELLESGTLRNHALQSLPKAFANAIRQVVAETGLAESKLPAECPYSLDQLLQEPIQ